MNNTATNILGIDVSAVTYQETLKRISSWIQNNQHKYICVAAVHLIMECQNNQTLFAGVGRAGLTVPDGMPLVWLSKCAGQKKVERIYGPSLMLKMCALAEKTGWKIFLLGGSEGQGLKLSKELRTKFPKLHIAGHVDTPDKTLAFYEAGKIIKRINRTRARIIFVGLGCPFQEIWMINNHTKLNANILIGVGAAFNFITGKERQAGPAIQRMGMEWAHRLFQNPRRLFWRYTTTNICFVYLLTTRLLFSVVNKYIKNEKSS